MLLCAAAEEGDHDEVERLILHTQVSPNACGLRHKNALHLAAAKGHKQIVEFLLLNGVWDRYLDILVLVHTYILVLGFMFAHPP